MHALDQHVLGHKCLQSIPTGDDGAVVPYARKALGYGKLLSDGVYEFKFAHRNVPVNLRKYPNFSNISEMNRQRRRQKGRALNEDVRMEEP